MFSDGSQHIDDGSCGCPSCNPERCCDCGITLTNEPGVLCADCCDSRVSERVGAECAALVTDMLTASNRCDGGLQ